MGRHHFFLDAGRFEHFQILGGVHVDDAFGAELVDRLAIGGGEFVHHHAAVFAVADLGDDRRNGNAADVAALQRLRFVVRLHLSDQLRVGPLRLDDRDDRHFFAAGIFRHQPVRKVLVVEVMSFDRLDGVLLNEQPAVAAFLEGLDVFVGRVGMIGQMHFGRRETLHAAERFPAEHRGELLLPRPELQNEVGHAASKEPRRGPTSCRAIRRISAGCGSQVMPRSRSSTSPRPILRRPNRSWPE